MANIVRKMLLLKPELMQKITDFRFVRRYTSEADAFRELLEIGLKYANQDLSGVRVVKQKEEKNVLPD